MNKELIVVGNLRPEKRIADKAKFLMYWGWLQRY